MTQRLPATRSRLSASMTGLLLLFFLSGASALLYQVIWQRLLVFYTGSDTVSIRLIVTAFVTGLGVGYLIGGRLADRSSPTVNLRCFVGAEAGIMLFAAFSKYILYDLLYASAPSFGDRPVLLCELVFGVLLLPKSAGFSSSTLPVRPLARGPLPGSVSPTWVRQRCCRALRA